MRLHLWECIFILFQVSLSRRFAVGLARAPQAFYGSCDRVPGAASWTPGSKSRFAPWTRHLLVHCMWSRQVFAIIFSCIFYRPTTCVIMSFHSRRSLSSQPVSTTGQGQITTTTHTARGRSRSFVSALKRLLPSNRPERGGTIRSHSTHHSSSLKSSTLPAKKSASSASRSSERGPSDKLVRWNTATDLVYKHAGYTSSISPSTSSQQLYLERRERRRQRRSLKESGDYLGVQGVNPGTGEMDVVTPSTSTASSPFLSLARAVQNKRLAYENARKTLRSEKMRKWEMDKEALKKERKKKVKWMRRGEGWSSAVEPDLSPITGSSGVLTPREAELSTDTVVRVQSERSEGETETVDDSISTVHPATKVTASSSTGGHGIRRRPVPIRDRTLSSQKSYSDLIPFDSEFYPKQPPNFSRAGPNSAG